MDEATKTIESIRNSSNESATAMGELTDSVMTISEHVEELREYNQENDRLANELKNKIKESGRL